MKMTKMFARLVLVLVPLTAGIAVAGSNPQPKAVVISALILKVADRDGASNALVQKAESLGGYFKSLSTQMADFRIPVEKADEFLEFAEKQGTVVRRQYETEHTEFDLIRSEAMLKSREEIRAQYLDVLKKANAKTILTVEKEIADLIKGIEILKGSIRFKRHRLRFAEIQIAFDFRERSAPAPDGTSSFPWLNRLNLTDLVKEFRYAR